MIAIQELEKEHEAVKLSISLLDRIMEKLLTDPGTDQTDHLEGLLDFFQIFVDKCHHGKEEYFLFPALEKAGVQKQDGPIGVLLNEHETGRRYISQLKTQIPYLRKADAREITTANKLVKSYTALMQQHIQKEETILFPLADARLSEKEQTALFRKFENLETEKIGPGRHEEFHDMLKTLSSLY
jgi:hemerythrin-like domain-containing protein